MGRRKNTNSLLSGILNSPTIHPNLDYQSLERNAVKIIYAFSCFGEHPSVHSTVPKTLYVT